MSNCEIFLVQGTTTNGRYLLPFRTGAFLAGVPVQPVIIKYGQVRTAADPCHSRDGPAPQKRSLATRLHRNRSLRQNAGTVQTMPASADATVQTLPASEDATWAMSYQYSVD